VELAEKQAMLEGIIEISYTGKIAEK